MNLISKKRNPEERAERNILYTIGILIALYLVAPLIYFGFGYVAGLVIEFTLGRWVIEGLSIVGVYITMKQIPLLCGVLSLISMFFSSFEK
jgi:hypothetical protein